MCSLEGTALVDEDDLGRDPLAGVVLDGRYELLSRVGQGGLGFVYRASRVGLGKHVAVKMPFGEALRDPSMVRRFLREARTLAALDHPGCVTVLDFGGSETTVPYLVMELLGGEGLEHLLGRVGRVAPVRAVRIAMQLADALGAAHQAGIVHRDLKPENVRVISREGADEIVKILDFGFALVFHDSGPGGERDRLTKIGTVLGTPEYMAPEQWLGTETGPTTDLYALGLVLYEMLAGALPFEGESPSALMRQHVEAAPPPLTIDVPAGIADELAAVVARLLVKDPAKRTPSAADLLVDLRHVDAALRDAQTVRTADAPPRIGRRFAHFVLLERIARGAASEMHLGLTSDVPGRGRPVAVKRLLPHLSLDPVFVQRFEAEIRRVLPLSHGGIAQVWELGRATEGEVEEIFVVMEHVSGKDLGRLFARGRQQRRAIPLGVALYVARSICDALACAHRQPQPGALLHEDVSPRNVLLSYDGAVKLVDFGLARALAAAGQTHAGVVLGKLRYLAPEQTMPGRAPVTTATDVYAAGLLLFEMLTGTPRFYEGGHRALLEAVRAPQPLRPSERAPDAAIPEDVDEIVVRALAAAPERRIRSAAEMRDDLAAAISRHAPRVSADDLAALLRELFANEADAEQGRLRAALDGNWVPPTDPEVVLPSVALTSPGDLVMEATAILPTRIPPTDDVRSIPDTNPGTRQAPSRESARSDAPTDPDEAPPIRVEVVSPPHVVAAPIPRAPATREPARGTPTRESSDEMDVPVAPSPAPAPHPFASRPRRHSGVLVPLLVLTLVAIATAAVFLLAAR